MTHDQLPDHWKAWIQRHTVDRKHPDRLSAEDFMTRRSVRLLFSDGSTAFFRFAFLAVDDERRELAVFTEHCGYHVFPLHDLSYSVVDEVDTPH